MIEIEKLNGQVISRVEHTAAIKFIIPGERGYKTRVAEIAAKENLSKDTVDAIITKNIGETWKSLKPSFPKYKVSNFGRVMGPKGMLSSYVSKSGTELVDPYDADGNRKHLSIKRAVSTAFLRKPKKAEKIRYKTAAKINAVHNLIVA